MIKPTCWMIWLDLDRLDLHHNITLNGKVRFLNFALIAKHFYLWMDLAHTGTKQHLWPNRHVEWLWSDLDMILTGKVRFFNFALIAITFSFMDGLIILWQNNTDDLTEMLDDFHMTLTFVWPWLARSDFSVLL